jgi:3-hydroxyisobutyrate dehydrogenase
MAYRALEQPRIGWIGAGRMGRQMAARLLDTGHNVAIYNRTAAKAAPMVSRGAVAVERPADLADRDVAFASAATAMVASALGAGYRTEDFATLIREQARHSGITPAAENVKVDDGLEAL